MERFFTVAGGISGAIAVACGAFGAHALEARLAPEALATFETGARYHFYHALALFGAAGASARWPGRATTAAGWLFLVGTGLFSGSLYLLSLTGVRWLGAITPLGGAAFIAGWLSLAGGAWRVAAPGRRAKGPEFLPNAED
jgi:uncharacterized membrane protein YgdD (TMEM256/DUF423 family)